MYFSKYSSPPGKKITANQYILELICEKNAGQTNRELPLQFWKLPQWKVFYGSQIKRCSELLNKYSDSSVIKALKDKRCKKTFSLKGAWFEKIIQEYENNKSESMSPAIQELPEGGSNFQRDKFRSNLLDKLNE